jgi:hypothetical protein
MIFSYWPIKFKKKIRKIKENKTTEASNNIIIIEKNFPANFKFT